MHPIVIIILIFKSKNMKSKILLVAIAIIYSLPMNATVWTVVTSGLTYSPATITVSAGDTIDFVLSGNHDAREVSQSTYNMNGSTALSGGFQVPFGGGDLLTAGMSLGMHYYVCSNHNTAGMKGTINVQSATGINENSPNTTLLLFPNPTTDIITVKASQFQKNAAYSICDQNGKTVLNGVMDAETFTLDVNNFAAGLYFFLVDGIKQQTFNVVK